jgi:hypothetical protein
MGAGLDNNDVFGRRFPSSRGVITALHSLMFTDLQIKILPR